MIVMRYTDQILDTAKQHQGFITSALVDKMGISRGILHHLVKLGKLERIDRGIYVIPGSATGISHKTKV